MNFLVDASLPRMAADMLREMGHHAVDVRDISIGRATDAVIAAHARSNQWALITRDFDFADVRNDPPPDYAGLVVLQFPEDANTASRTAGAAQQATAAGVSTSWTTSSRWPARRR